MTISETEDEIRDTDSAEPETPPSPLRRKIADRPHGWTLIFSVSALCVSILSLWQSNRATKISEATSRAMVQVTAVRLPSDPAQMTFLNIDVELKNYGKTMARNIRTAYDWEVSMFDVPIAQPTYFQPPHHDLAPGGSEVVRLQANRGFYGGRGVTSARRLDSPKQQLLVSGVTNYTYD